MEDVGEVLYDSPHLTVTGASGELVLGLKLEAGRENDFEDVALLAAQLNV